MGNGTLCGARIKQTGDWQILIFDFCNLLTGKTLGPVTLQQNIGFYLDLQYDCAKWYSDCNVKFVVSYLDSSKAEYDKKTYTKTVGWFGGTSWVSVGDGPLPAPTKDGYVKIDIYCDGVLEDYFYIQVKLESAPPPAEECGKLCGVRVKQTGDWQILAFDFCNLLTGRTLGPVTLQQNVGFYVDLQYDCAKWYSDCSVKFVVIYLDSNKAEYSRRTYSKTVGWFGGTGWVSVGDGPLPAPTKDGYVKIEIYCDGKFEDHFYIQVKLQAAQPPSAGEPCGKLCGVRIRQTGDWQVLAFDLCDVLTGRTLGPAALNKDASVYLELQYDCEKWYSDCSVKFVISYLDSNKSKYEELVYYRTVGWFGGTAWVNPANGPLPPPTKDGYIKVEIWCDGVLEDHFYIQINLKSETPPPSEECGKVYGVRIKQTGDWQVLASNQHDQLKGRTFGPVTLQEKTGFYLNLQFDCTKWYSDCSVKYVINYLDSSKSEYDKLTFSRTVSWIGGEGWVTVSDNPLPAPSKDGYIKVEVYCDGKLETYFYIQVKLQTPPPPPPSEGPCGQLCGVRIKQTGDWQILAFDLCDLLKERTLGPVTLREKTGFYLDVQYDCVKWYSDCSVKFVVSYLDANKAEYDKKTYTKTVGWFGGTGWVSVGDGALSAPTKDGYVKIEIYCDNKLESWFFIQVKLISEEQPPPSELCGELCGVRIRQGENWQVLVSDQCGQFAGRTFGPVYLQRDANLYLEVQYDCTKWLSDCELTFVLRYLDTNKAEYDKKTYSKTAGWFGGSAWISPAEGAVPIPTVDGYIRVEIWCESKLQDYFLIEVKLQTAQPPQPPPSEPGEGGTVKPEEKGKIIVEIDADEEQIKDTVIYYDSASVIAGGKVTEISVEKNVEYRVRCSKKGYVFIPFEAKVKPTDEQPTVKVTFKMISQLLILGIAGGIAALMLIVLLIVLMRRK